MPVFLKKIKKIIPSTIFLPASKSESNRALIINALAKGDSIIENLSEARDTQIMLKLLGADDKTLDVLDAGTTMRFLTAFFSVTNSNKILTGTERMRQRPIGILVDALKRIGVEIEYMEKDGFPPIEIKRFAGQITNEVAVSGETSSQFISALLMIAPVMEKGLTITLTGKVASRPYIDMTLGIMKEFGVTASWDGNIIRISHQDYKPVSFGVAPDWSAASYWYSIVALAEEAELHLPGLFENSYQGDKVIAAIMEHLGVHTTYEPTGIVLSKKDHKQELSWDFSNCPDLAQTVAVTAAAKGITLKMTGIESLRIKETDRVAALRKELGKIGTGLMEMSQGEWLVIPGAKGHIPESCNFETYEDHRMAMAFSPLAMVSNVNIQDHTVVRKSYPGFWKDLAVAGMEVTIIA